MRGRGAVGRLCPGSAFGLAVEPVEVDAQTLRRAIVSNVPVLVVTQPGPKPLEGLPAAGAQSGTTQGGGGYTDAYGNTVDDRQPEEKAPRQRPRPGAYGSYGSSADSRPLPDPTPRRETPAWSFK